MRYGSLPASVSELSERYRQAVARISVYLREKCAERITVNEAAAAVGLSAAYASLLFKKTTGMSLKAYMTKVRMERAMHLLTETTMNVSQIADALGYTSVYLFSRQFSRHFDSPPSHYRQRAIPTKPTGRRQPSTPIE
jgi:transcriptional regulator GlxA family with amidase domain